MCALCLKLLIQVIHLITLSTILPKTLQIHQASANWNNCNMQAIKRPGSPIVKTLYQTPLLPER
jgi:hypothetical protein